MSSEDICFISIRSVFRFPRNICKHFLMLSVCQLVDDEMFWVATEVCSETNMMKRVRIVKQFIKIASELASLFLLYYRPLILL